MNETRQTCFRSQKIENFLRWAWKCLSLLLVDNDMNDDENFNFPAFIVAINPDIDSNWLKFLIGSLTTSKDLISVNL